MDNYKMKHRKLLICMLGCAIITSLALVAGVRILEEKLSLAEIGIADITDQSEHLSTCGMCCSTWQSNASGAIRISAVMQSNFEKDLLKESEKIEYF